MPSTLADMGRHRFVSLTTFRRSGQPVATPVWIAPDGDALVVTTPADSGKVKRLRHDPRVELRPCTRSGTVALGAPTTTAVARVVPTDPRSTAALEEKYRLQYRLIALLEKVVWRSRGERVILRITST